MTRKCKICKIEYTAQTHDELKRFFYFKSGYFLNTCITCELKKHSTKYKDGKYNYHQKEKDSFYDHCFSFGNHRRCRTMSGCFS